MKKITFLLLSYSISLASFSQSIPNSGFETWYNNNELSEIYWLPQGWMSGDMVNKAFNSAYTGVSVSQSNQGYSGYAVKMETVINSGDTVGGDIESFQSIYDFYSMFNGGTLGFPYSIRSSNLQGYYKFNSVGNDSAYVYVSMTKWNTTTNVRDALVDTIYKIGANASSYTLFNLPITYQNSESPDTVYISAGIKGPGNHKSHVGTTFYIDAFSFTGTTPLGIDDLHSHNRYVKLYPNPSNGLFIIENKDGLNQHLQIVDLSGKVVLSQSINGNATIDASNLSNGVYTVLLTGNEINSATKLIILK